MKYEFISAETKTFKRLGRNISIQNVEGDKAHMFIKLHRCFLPTHANVALLRPAPIQRRIRGRQVPGKSRIFGRKGYLLLSSSNGNRKVCYILGRGRVILTLSCSVSEQR
jgi:hypothetical protein